MQKPWRNSAKQKWRSFCSVSNAFFSSCFRNFSSKSEFSCNRCKAYLKHKTPDTNNLLMRRWHFCVTFDVTTEMAGKNQAALAVCAQTKVIFPFKFLSSGGSTTTKRLRVREEPLGLRYNKILWLSNSEYVTVLLASYEFFRTFNIYGDRYWTVTGIYT